MISKNLFCFLFYFTIVLCIGFFIRDIPYQPNILINIQDFVSQNGKVSELGDVFNFAEGAIDIYYNGWIKPENYWRLRLWPPGFMYLEGMILKIFGLDAPFIFILIVLNSFFITGFLLLFRLYLLRFLPKISSSILPLVPFCFPVTRFFLLEPAAIILGEGFAIVFFLSAILFLLFSFRDRGWKNAIYSGILLAAAAYMRPQFEIIILFLTITLFLICIVYLIQKTIFFKRQVISLNYFSNIKIMLLILLVAHSTMLPWRIHNYKERRAFSWVCTSKLFYENAGKTEQEMNEKKAGFFIEGGGNLPCKIDPSYCGKNDAFSFYKVFFTNMIAWYRHKINLLPGYWFSSLRNYTNIVYLPTYFDKIINTIYLFCVLITFPLLFWTRFYKDAQVYSCMCISFYSCFFVIFTFFHFETRYFYLMKIFSLFSVIILANFAWHLVKARRRLVSSHHQARFGLASLNQGAFD